MTNLKVSSAVVVVLLILKRPISFCQSGTSPFFEGVAEHEMRTIKGSVYRTKRRKQIPAEERRLGTNLFTPYLFLKNLGLRTLRTTGTAVVNTGQTGEVQTKTGRASNWAIPNGSGRV